MSTLKKSAKSGQRIHRERSQPEHRAHLGVLEKKKDYILRARDYNEKKRKLRFLRRKALDRNPDEFHYHMVRSELRVNLLWKSLICLVFVWVFALKIDGVHHDITPEPDEDTKLQKKLSNIQDLKYLRHRLNVENKKIEKLKATLHLADMNAFKSTHTIFVDDDAQAKNFDLVKYFDTKEELLDRTYNRPSVSTLGSETILTKVSKANVMEVEQERHFRYNELLKRMERAMELKVAVEKLEVRKNIAESKGKQLKPKKVIAKGEPMKARVFEWVYERKK
ncbi:unnamed protein product [Enterobius vermicularis]|uniref:U3 small nucleolar RNA-associated protein 11 n=1 Tax=Enterobius vermicularis TaxID=51028 RepID=A0A0N4V592_ENTVE|nr:unnamed protein product [Enterobius vermicularis]